MTIKFKILSLIVLSCLLLFGSFIANILYQEKSVSTQIDNELIELMHNNTKSVAQNVASQLETLNEVLLAEVENGLKVSWKVLNMNGQSSLSDLETIEWNAVNQYTKTKVKIRLPKMLIGGHWLGQNSSLTVPSPIVDDVKELVGGTTTIFQRINTRGDMLRVCTNVESNDKTRAIETYIPAMNPDGTENPVIKALISGQTYSGRAYVVNAWFLTTYQPIYNQDKEVIGALYFGIRQEKSEALRRGIRKTVVGQNGYVYILDRSGNYIVSKDGKRDGENILYSKDRDGEQYIKRIIEKAIKLNPGEITFERYSTIESGQTTAKMKMAAITYFEPWGWIVGAGAYEDDFKKTKIKMQDAIYKMVLWGCLIGGVMTVLILIAATFISGKITKPIVELTKAANEISRGNLDLIIDIDSKDETGQLALAFKRMQLSVIKLMQRAQKQKNR